MIIKEFLPNPVGKDTDGEYIKLFNNGPEAVLLNGWSLKDVSGKIYKLSRNLEAGKELVLPYSQTKIALNNNGERIFLYDNAGKLVDELSYSGQAEEGQIIVKSSKLNVESLTNEEAISNFPIINGQSSISKIIFIDFLTAAILAGIGLYIILNIEKKLDIKLW